MKIHRETFLHILESVSPGLTRKETIQNSNTFCFSNSEVFTFNEEIACRMKTGLDDSIIGAVPAERLLGMLKRLPEDEIDLSIGECWLIIRGKNKRTRFRREQEMVLSLDSVEQPSEWQTLPPEFAEAISTVRHCCGTDRDEVLSTCVHLTPDYVEATNRFQLCRWPLTTGLTKDNLIKKPVVKHIASLGMMEVAETEYWIHFRNPRGLVLSCRRYLEDFPNLDAVLQKVTGNPVTLPKGLADAAINAQEMSQENVEGDIVRVQLKSDRVLITGEGVNGDHTEMKKLSYGGDPIEFLIAPELLADIVKRHNDCLIGPNCLKVDNGKYVYISWLKVPEIAAEPEVMVPQGKPVREHK